MSAKAEGTTIDVPDESGRPGTEQRLRELDLNLPSPPQPFGTYAEAAQTGNLLFLTGMLPREGRSAKYHQQKTKR
jgi:hypothetical protein